MCLRPHTIVNPHYKKWPTELQSYTTMPFDYFIRIPCGQCCDCQKKKRRDWSIRLGHEVRYHAERLKRLPKKRVKDCIPLFVTLTIDPEHYSEVSDDPSRAIRLFLERYRKRYKHTLRHWFCTEYGEDTNRLHFHGIIFEHDFPCTYQSFERHVYSKKQRAIFKRKYGPFKHKDGVVAACNRWLQQMWTYGITWVDAVKPETANYIVKYISKELAQGRKSRIFTSPGIGRAYTQDPANVSFHRNNGRPIWNIPTDDPSRVLPLPMYYIRKIIPDIMRKEYSFNMFYSPPYSRKLRGMTYNDEYSYDNAINSFYLDSLSRGTSPSVRHLYANLDIPYRLLVRWIQQSTPTELTAMYNTLINLGYKSERLNNLIKTRDSWHFFLS